VAARLGTPEVTARTRVQRALTSLRARLGSLRAMFLVPGTQAAVLALTVVTAQLPVQPSPLAMADDDVVSERPARRPVRLIAHPAAVTADKTGKADKAVEKPAPADARQDVTTYSAVQRFKFDDDEIVSDVLGPDDIRLMSIRKADQPSLIEIRQHFVPEMVKSLEEY
jgi:hypothetical protein